MMDKASTLIGRLLLGHIFLLSGISKIGGYAATQGWMEAMGVPGMLLPGVILLEIAGSAALIIGWQARAAAVALAAFSIAAALLFHNNLSDQMQMIMFMKNLAIAGGLLFVFVHGPGAWSVDERRTAKRLPAQDTTLGG
ncbi:MAG: DoxX family protein [Gammaproteobacteria bacterium]